MIYGAAMAPLHHDHRLATVRTALAPGIAAGPARLVLGGRFGEQPASDSHRLLDRFYAAGGRLVETAAAYAGGAGERTLGSWLRRAPADVVCITKVGHPVSGSTAIDVDGLEQELDRSAERLGVGGLDVVLLHRDDPRRSVAELLGPLLGAAAEGRVVGVGVANWRAPRLREAVEVAASRGGLLAASSQLSLAVPTVPLWPGTLHADPEVLALHRDLDLPLLAWSANARGWFGGRLLGEPSPDPDARRSFHTAANLHRLDRCRAVAAALGSTPAAVALGWTLGCVPMALPVIGPADGTELDDALAGARTALSREDLAELSAVS